MLTRRKITFLNKVGGAANAPLNVFAKKAFHS